MLSKTYNPSMFYITDTHVTSLPSRLGGLGASASAGASTFASASVTFPP